MTAGQRTIFDELADLDADTGDGVVTCPHCHFSWTGPGLLDKHIEGSNGWPFGGSEYGKCENQRSRLYQLGAQQFFGLRLRSDEPNIAYRTDLLGAILRARERGCTDRQIKAVLKAARTGGK